MLASSISQLIESCGLCQAGEVKAIQTMKAGMTNRSCICKMKVDTHKSVGVYFFRSIMNMERK